MTIRCDMLTLFCQTRSLNRGGSGKVLTGLDSFMNQVRHPQIKDSGNGQKASVAKLFEQGRKSRYFFQVCLIND